MELIEFRVSMYKGIIDSGWVKVKSLTVFVGKNESGKTSLLKALHKLNPYNPEPYEMAKEWPRACRKGQDEKHIVCQAKFQLSEQEKSDLAEIIEQNTFPDTVDVSRNYADDDLKINCEGNIFSEKPHPEDLNVMFDSLPEIQDKFSTPFKECAEKCLIEAKNLASERQFTKLKRLVEEHKSMLRKKRVKKDAASYSIEGRFINQYSFSQIVKNIQQLPTDKSKVRDYVIRHLPTFVYMDDYRVFSGTAHLNDIKIRRDQKRSTEEDKTFLTILSLSGLNLDKLITTEQDDGEKVGERLYDLDDGASTLTKIISDRFQQRTKYEVDYRVGGQSFFTFVKDNHDSSLIRLEERSKGFQWFFSFDLMLMHETQGTFQNCVILLDEPGLHLHPKAQKKLLERLEEYSNENTILYTTHLPFMIDLNHPSRIRMLTKTDNGIVVTTDIIESSPDAKFVLQAALGMDASQSFLVADRNLVVEGVDDYWVLTELSNLLQLDGKEGLPEDVLITPGGSASTAVHIATIMIGQNLDVVVLFDSDNEGRRAQEKLDHNWLTQYNKTQTKTMLLGEAVGACSDFALEDLFPENFITDIIKDAYKKELAAVDADEITLQGEGIIWQRIKRFMEGKGIEKINKGPFAKRLRNKLSSMKDFSQLPDETQEKSIKLFEVIRKAFGEQD